MTMGIHNFTCYDMIRRNAEVFGEKPAWLDAEDGRAVSFADFREKVDRLACGLQNVGVGKGDRLGVLGKNSLEYFLVYGAAAALGAIVLPINWRLSEDEMVFNLNDCEPKILFGDIDFQSTIRNALDRIPSVEHCLNLNNGGEFGPFDALLENSGEFRAVDVAPGDGFVIIHTAAVGGRPRGALLSHGNVLWANVHLNYGLGVTDSDAHLNLLPLFHVAGLFMATNSFHAGALNVNMRKFDPESAAALIEENQVSVMFDFSPVLGNLLDAGATANRDLRSLKRVIGLDSPETIERYQQETGGAFFCMYGQTETSCLATMGPYNRRPGAAGRPIALARVALVDDADRMVAPGETGEIVVRGPMVFKGYWGKEDETTKTFRNGWHHTGDMGRFDADGYLFFAGRKADKELIKPGGENVYPAEVENVLLAHPDVEEAVVFGVPDPKWKEGIKAVCVLRAGVRLSPEALIEFVGERIARFKKPQYVDFVDALPTTAAGLIDRVEVKKRHGGLY